MSIRYRSTRASAAKSPTRSPSNHPSPVPTKLLSQTSGDETPKRVIRISEVEAANRRIKLNLLASFVAACFITGVVFLAVYDLVKFYPKMLTPISLKGYSSRAEYALRYQVLQLFWLLCNTYFVTYGKYLVRPRNLLASPTKDKLPNDAETKIRLKELRNVLNNSFEQLFISFFSQLIFVSFAQPDVILKLIPVINIIQLFGRIAFFAGYPKYRGFGFTLSILPNTGLVFYAVYRLGIFVKLY